MESSYTIGRISNWTIDDIINTSEKKLVDTWDTRFYDPDSNSLLWFYNSNTPSELKERFSQWKRRLKEEMDLHFRINVSVKDDSNDGITVSPPDISFLKGIVIGEKFEKYKKELEEEAENLQKQIPLYIQDLDKAFERGKALAESGRPPIELDPKGIKLNPVKLFDAPHREYSNYVAINPDMQTPEELHRTVKGIQTLRFGFLRDYGMLFIADKRLEKISQTWDHREQIIHDYFAYQFGVIALTEHPSCAELSEKRINELDLLHHSSKGVTWKNFKDDYYMNDERSLEELKRLMINKDGDAPLLKCQARLIDFEGKKTPTDHIFDHTQVVKDAGYTLGSERYLYVRLPSLGETGREDQIKRTQIFSEIAMTNIIDYLERKTVLESLENKVWLTTMAGLAISKIIVPQYRQIEDLISVHTGLQTNYGGKECFFSGMVQGINIALEYLQNQKWFNTSLSEQKVDIYELRKHLMRIQAVPLVETEKEVFNIRKETEDYSRFLDSNNLFIPPEIFVFIAGSDTASQLGAPGRNILNFIAISDLYQSQRKFGIPIATLLGYGPSSMRGNIHPQQNMKQHMPGAQSVTYQPSYCYDDDKKWQEFRLNAMRNSVFNEPIVINNDERDILMGVIGIFAKHYLSELPKWAKLDKRISELLPAVRGRKGTDQIEGDTSTYTRGFELHLPRLLPPQYHYLRKEIEGVLETFGDQGKFWELLTPRMIKSTWSAELRQNPYTICGVGSALHELYKEIYVEKRPNGEGTLFPENRPFAGKNQDLWNFVMNTLRINDIILQDAVKATKRRELLEAQYDVFFGGNAEPGKYETKMQDGSKARISKKQFVDDYLLNINYLENYVKGFEERINSDESLDYDKKIAAFYGMKYDRSKFVSDNSSSDQEKKAQEFFVNFVKRGDGLKKFTVNNGGFDHLLDPGAKQGALDRYKKDKNSINSELNAGDIVLVLKHLVSPLEMFKGYVG